MRLNLGCGRDVKEGWTNVDIKSFGPDVVELDLSLFQRWPWADDSVDEVLMSHAIEHFNSRQRAHILNEMWRVMKQGAKATIVAPHWGSNRAYGDPTHEWPPVSEMWFYYLGKAWRDEQAPHTNDLFKCDFDCTWGYSINPAIQARNAEFQQFALNHYREAAMDIHATLVKR